MSSYSYIFCENINDKIFHRYIEGTNRYCEILDKYQFEIYTKDNGGMYKSLYGDSLKKIIFDSVEEFKDYIRFNDKNKLFGQQNVVYQFLGSAYKDEIDFYIDDLNLLFIDIETAFEREFPDPNKANQEILTISCNLLNKDEVIVFGTRDFHHHEKNNELYNRIFNKNYEESIKSIIYHKCKDEKELLIKFQDEFNKLEVDFLVGYNILGFDLPYLINRSRFLLGDNFINKYSPFSSYFDKCVYKSKSSGENEEIYNILGINILDYYIIYKKYSGRTLESNTLDHVSISEIGEGKIEFDGNLMELYDRDYERYVLYNINDIILLKKIDKVRQFLNLILTLVYMGKIRFKDSISRTRFWDNYIYNELLKKSIQIPPNIKKSFEPIKGAHVKDVIPGKYNWIVTFDLTSLYPSIIWGLNISPETKVEKIDINNIDKFLDRKIDLSFLKKKKRSMSLNGVFFDNKMEGILPYLIERMFNDRKKLKQDTLELEKLLEVEENEIIRNEYNSKNTKQYVLKIELNSLYGALCSDWFRYADPELGEAVTITGQYIIKYIIYHINEKLNSILKTNGIDYVVMSDTDSICITLKEFIDKYVPIGYEKLKIINFIDKFLKRDIEPFLASKFEEIHDYFNFKKNTLYMKREIIGDVGIWRKKKNYIMQIYDSEGVRFTKPKIKIKGIETVKTSTPPLVRKFLNDCIIILLNGEEEELQKIVEEYKEIFMDSSLVDISSPRTVTDIDKWDSKSSEFMLRTPIHVKASLLYNNLIDKFKLTMRRKIVNGDKIRYIYLKEPNEYMCNAIAFFDDLPIEFKLDQFIDKSLQFEKTFIKPLASLVEIIGWNIKKIETLDSFFC